MQGKWSFLGYAQFPSNSGLGGFNLQMEVNANIGLCDYRAFGSSEYAHWKLLYGL
jgi:hypothetical protein